jgi:hypothetical protein
MDATARNIERANDRLAEAVTEQRKVVDLIIGNERREREIIQRRFGGR